MTITNKELARKKDRESGNKYIAESDAAPLQKPRKAALEDFKAHLRVLESVGIRSTSFSVAHLQKLMGIHSTSRKEDE
jgi:hypothetical protein